MPREFHTDVDLKRALLLSGSAGTSGQIVYSGGPNAPAVWGNPPTGGGGGGGGLRMTYFAGTSGTWTNMPSAVAFFLGNAAFIQKCDLSNFTECRLLVNKTGVAGNSSAILELEYSTTYTQTPANYISISSTPASVAVNVQNTYLDSGWNLLVAGAKSDVFVSVIGSGGNGQLDPQFGHIIAEFR
jgi:hypothetical protein